MTVAVAIVGGLLAAGVVWIVATRQRRGALNSAFWLVVIGVVIVVLEHPMFATTYAAQVLYPEADGFVFNDHARIHFFMAGVYAFFGLVVLVVVGRTLLREGRRAGWFTVLGALSVGALDLVLGGIWYEHGSPLYALFGAERPEGFGWPFLYAYLLAWTAALVISYRPVFHQTARTNTSPHNLVDPPT